TVQARQVAGAWRACSPMPALCSWRLRADTVSGTLVHSASRPRRSAAVARWRPIMTGHQGLCSLQCVGVGGGRRCPGQLPRVRTAPMPEVARPEQAEPRWPALLALLAVGGISMALPDSLTIGPRWLLLVLVSGLLVPAVITHRHGQLVLNRVLGL